MQAGKKVMITNKVGIFLGGQEKKKGKIRRRIESINTGYLAYISFYFTTLEGKRSRTKKGENITNHQRMVIEG